MTDDATHTKPSKLERNDADDDDYKVGPGRACLDSATLRIGR
jgi:hypothetical protein